MKAPDEETADNEQLISKSPADLQDVELQDLSQKGTDIEKPAAPIAPRRPGAAMKSFCQKMRAAWNPLTNLRDLFCPRGNEAQLAVLDGIRGFAMMWVMCVHSWIFLGWTHFGEQAYQDLEVASYMRLIRNGELSVDMFFVLSGFLIAHILIREHEKTGQFSFKRFYIRRFLRIFPAYMFVFMFYWPGINIMKKYVACANCDGCDNFGWMNILFINNFAPVFSSCMAWTWSIAVEVQYYVFSPFVVWVFLKRRLFGFIALGVLIVAGSITRACLIWFNNLYLPSDPGFFMDVLYTKPYGRAGPYLIGMLTGMVWAVWRDKCKDFRPSRRQAIVWLLLEGVVIATFLLIVLLGKGAEPHPPIAWFVFLWIHRDVWGICTAFLIFTSLVSSVLTKTYPGRKPLFLYVINAYQWSMSWRIWYIAAQLSYAAYLVHPIWITIFYMQLAPNVPASFWWFICCSIVNILVSNVVSLFVHLVIERPIMNLRY
eukprot:TRINITY_DN13472_c0_g1_i1.p1 TRINITY_DN13472_c0_g1~~TRINITY_DN13472_c0_g1_i1.p1  ORF type:complete len:503 (+),score=80.39 TRINITY_DN13472_c0_g1_i1:57-1511(+)